MVGGGEVDKKIKTDGKKQKKSRPHRLRAGRDCDHGAYENALFDELNATLQELVERFALEHAVLQECKVDELMYDSVLLAKVGKQLLLLVFLLGDGLLGVGFVVFLLL